MKKSLQKIITLSLFLILLVPQVAVAAWWNPFSWFKKKEVVEVVRQQPEVVQPPIFNQSEVGATVIEKEKTSIVPTKTVNTPTPVTTSVIPTVTPTPVVTQLLVSGISVVPSASSVKVSWSTNIDSESKVILEGKSYISQRGVGKIHSVTISGLESDLPYSGTITAIANTAWKSESFTFKTEQAPLKVTIESSGCSSNDCAIKWYTNYKSSGTVKIFKDGSSDVYKTISSSSNGKDHSVMTNLPFGANYKFEIRATSDNQMGRASGSLSIPAKPTNNPSCGTGCYSPSA